MKIQQIQNNNINFQGLHMDKRASKYFKHYNLLANPSIKECADKFEVVIKQEKIKTTNIIDKEFLKGALSIGLPIAGGMGFVIGGVVGLFLGLSLKMPSLMGMLPCLGGVFGFTGACGYVYREEQ